jgi:hypothetical protein
VADTGQHRPKDAMRAYTKIGVVFTELA